MTNTITDTKLPTELLPITDAKQLRIAIMRDRGQRFTDRANDARQNVRLIIDRQFEFAKEIHADGIPHGIWTPTEQQTRRACAKLYQLWGYVDGLIVGICEGLLSADETHKLRQEWNSKCDETFGDLVGVILNLHD